MADGAARVGIGRDRILATALVLALTLGAMVFTTYLVGRADRSNMETELQKRATEIARSIDLQLRTYMAALETIAQSSSLREAFDLGRVEGEARRVGQLFGGWFVITAGGDGETIQQLMNTLRPEGTLAPPASRTNYPELMRAEAESIRLRRGVVSDAFKGRLANELIVSVVTVIDTDLAPSTVLGFVVSLRDITNWLEKAALAEDGFAAIADGARRVIARSRDNQEFLLVDLPDWYVSYSEGRNIGVTVGPPVGGGAPRLFAMQRLEVAPGWTLTVSRPPPLLVEAALNSAWPALSGLLVLLLGGGIASLLIDRKRAKSAAAQAAGEAAERGRLLNAVRAADARKARLMAVLAHDLRTPLVAVLGALDLFRADQNRASQDRLLDRVMRDGHGMLQLIDDVLELARLGAGEARLRPEPFTPVALLDEVANLVRPQAGLKGTVIEVQADAAPRLLGDLMALRRVILNFTTNAVKATRGGSIRLSATLDGVGAGGHSLTFAVSDTGCGIAAADVPRLFRDFGMLERDGITADGTGLGLAICRRLATAMGGQVGVESAVGEGSRFWLRVTLPDANDTAPALDDVEENSLAVLAGLRVLVAEDHDTIRQVTCANLARFGALPTEAADGDIAVTLAESTKFDVILMDLRMPRLDGGKAAARIRRDTGPSRQARIIGVTAHQRSEIAVMLSDLAFDACLQKPINLRSLAALLQGAAPPAPASGPSEDFDPDNLEYLRQLDGGALFAGTLKEFSAQIETSKTKLASLIADGDIVGAGRLAHKLIGFCAILGAGTLLAELRDFEALIDAGDIEALGGAFERIDNVMSKTRTKVDRLIEESNLCSRSEINSAARK
jgi:signal transduction histidine kinase/FixJ family two-component response regulator/HPt (histidine-containing phosphotransfer) domain-containing protein